MSGPDKEPIAPTTTEASAEPDTGVETGVSTGSDASAMSDPSRVSTKFTFVLNGGAMRTVKMQAGNIIERATAVLANTEGTGGTFEVWNFSGNLSAETIDRLQKQLHVAITGRVQDTRAPTTPARAEETVDLDDILADLDLGPKKPTKEPTPPPVQVPASAKPMQVRPAARPAQPRTAATPPPRRPPLPSAAARSK